MAVTPGQAIMALLWNFTLHTSDFMKAARGLLLSYIVKNFLKQQWDRVGQLFVLE